jgi:hypothetical protein
MAHQWQQDIGTPPRHGYHNGEWAQKMEEIGLIPSNTGQPGGKRTGQRMSHYIDRDGRFMAAFQKMPKHCLLPWASGSEIEVGPLAGPPRNVRLTCPSCAVHVWIKPKRVGHPVGCLACGELFLTDEALRVRKEGRHEDD